MGLMTRPPVVGRDGGDSVGARYLLLMRYFCEGAGPGPGLQDRTKGETNTTDFIKAGGPPCRGGGWGPTRAGERAEMRRLTLRNGLYGYLASGLATDAGNSRLRISDRN